MSLRKPVDLGTPLVPGAATVQVVGRRTAGRPCRQGPRSCGPRPSPAWTSRSCAPRTPWRPSARAGCAWSRSTAARAPQPPARPRARRGMTVTTQTPRLEKLRRGVMELYISDHPLDCLTCPANGDCELQDMAGVVGLRDVRYGYDGREPPRRRERRQSNPYFSFDDSKCIACSRCVRACDEVQGTFALTIAGRGFDSRVSASAGEPLHGVRVRLVRRLRAGVPDVDAPGEDGHRARGPDQDGRDHLCLLRRRLLVQRRDARRPGRADGARQVRRRQRGPQLRQGPVRLGLRDPQGPPARADGPRRRSTSRGGWCPGRRRSATRPSASSSIQAEHGVGAIGGITSSRCTNEEVFVGAEDDPRGVRQQQRRHLRAGLPLPDRLRPQADVRHLGGHPGLRLGRRGRRDRGHRRQPDRRPPGVRLPDEAPAARGCRAGRRRPAPDRHGAHAAHRGRAPPAAAPGHQRRDRQRAGARRGDRGARRPGVRRGALRGRRASRSGRRSSPRRRTARRRSRQITGVPAADIRAAARLLRVRPQRRDLLRPRRHRAQPGLDDGHGHGEPRDGDRQHRPRRRRRQPAARSEQRAGLVRHGLLPARAPRLPARQRRHRSARLRGPLGDAPGRQPRPADPQHVRGRDRRHLPRDVRPGRGHRAVRPQRRRT